MGRIKTTPIRRVTNKIFKQNKDQFTLDFESNKKIVDSLVELQSKKFRNIIAGYATRLKRRDEK